MYDFNDSLLEEQNHSKKFFLIISLSHGKNKSASLNAPDGTNHKRFLTKVKRRFLFDRNSHQQMASNAGSLLSHFFPQHLQDKLCDRVFRMKAF